MLIKNALHFFYYISILVLFLAAKDECIFLEWGNIQTWSSDLIQYALGFMPDRGDIPCVSMFYFRHVIFIQRALDSHCLAAREIPAKSYFIVHNFTQMPQIFTVLSLLHTHISLLGELYNENIRSNLIPCIFPSHSEEQCHWEQKRMECYRNTGHTFIFSLTETKHKASWASAVADNLCINPRVKNLKPYLKYTSHHLCLDSLLRYSIRKEFVQVLLHSSSWAST